MASQVQIDFSNNSIRVFVERLIQIIYLLEAFRDDSDAFQASVDAFPLDATQIDDNSTGTAPRDDAPVLTGVEFNHLMTITDNMLAQVSPAVKEVLISKTKRDLVSLLRLGIS